MVGPKGVSAVGLSVTRLLLVGALLGTCACASFEVSFLASGTPSLGGDELPSCPCSRGEKDLLLRVRVRSDSPVPVSSLGVQVLLDGRDPLTTSVIAPDKGSLADDIVTVVIREQPPMGHVLQLDLRAAGGREVKGLRCKFTGVSK